MMRRWLLIMMAVAVRSVVAQVPGELTGRVTSREEVRPLPNVRVDDDANEGGATTNDRGEFALHGLTPGRHTLTVRAVGFAPAKATATIENGRTVSIDVTLTVLPAKIGAVTVGADSAHDATSISRADIDRSARRDLGAVLADQPGVLVLPQGGPGSPSHLSIRGSQSSEVLVLVDGVPINSPITGEADLSRIPLAEIEQITILRGAQSARWGPRALGGVVLIETRRPTTPEAALDVSAGSWGEREGTLTVGVSNATLTATRRQSRGDFPYDVPDIRGGGVAMRGNDEMSSGAVAAAATATVGSTAMHARATFDDDARGLPGAVGAPSPTAHGSDDRLALGLDARSDAGPVRWTVDLNADRQHTRFNDSMPPIGVAYDNHIQASSLTAQASATVGGRELSGSVGGESRLIGITATDLAPNAPTEEHEAGVWVRGEVAHDLGATTRLSLDATVRTDWSSLLSGPQLSPRLTLTATHQRLTASVSTGSAFSPPSLADQFFHEGVLVQPNPNLQPERIRAEVEGRLAIRDVALTRLLHASVDVAAYRANVDGMILWFPDYRFVWSPQNTNVRRSGLDASAELAMPALGVRVHGTVTDVSVDYATPSLDGQVAYRPRLAAAITTSFDRGPGTLDLTTHYIGGRRTVEGSQLNALDAYWVTDAQLTVHVLRAPWSLDLLGGVDDLFDRRVALLFDYPLPNRTWTIGLRLHTPSHAELP